VWYSDGEVGHVLNRDPELFMRCNTRFPSVLFVIAGTSAAAHADVVFADTEFINSNWALETVSLGAGGTASAAQVATGNPGNARRVSLSPNAGGGLWAFSRFGTTTATRYAPATDGAIAAVAFSFDARVVTSDAALPVRFALKQGQAIFAVGEGVLDTGSSWQTFSLAGLTAASFTRLDGVAGTPDFSAAGAPIRFGFAVGALPGGSIAEKVTNFDNFSVRVTQVPGPGVAALGVVLATLAPRRRRKSPMHP
jgi:hypothetical protein